MYCAHTHTQAFVQMNFYALVAAAAGSVDLYFRNIYRSILIGHEALVF